MFIKRNFKRSYSQCGEDLILRHVFNSIGISNPDYIDIGANDPFSLNNTALFYASGSKGINVEPNPSCFKKIEKHRKKDINLNIGIAENSGEMIFYQMYSDVLSTFSYTEAMKREKEIIKTEKIKVLGINDLFEKYKNQFSFDLINIDIEGLDEQIIKSINFEKYSPKVFCIETVEIIDNNSWTKNKNIINYLVSKGYLYHSDTCINSIFVREDLIKSKYIDK